ncbi:hypothetical protein AYO22_05103 [Fonsecaea multimorphosa]|nr:hypothetical protein AYO22_05103 [Fonsecaea multimorphosa]
METAVNENDLQIPLIDISSFESGDSATKLAVAKALTHGFQTSGFVYLKNHRIPQSEIDSLFSTAAAFFNRPQHEKNQLSWGMQGRSSSPGYTAYGGEKLSQSLDQAEIDRLRASNPDMKEALDVGLERIEGAADNKWPGEIDRGIVEMKLVIQGFFERCRQTQVVVMRAIALGLGLEERYFDALVDEADNTLRCLHYPPARAEVFERSKDAVRAGAHSDYGALTLLFQDDRGGLQICSPNGRFVDATPVPGTIVVNAGDLLSRWANDKIKSTVHRVVQPPMSPDALVGDLYPSRYSVAYFCNPNLDTVIQALPGTWEETGLQKYEPITAREWLMRRLILSHTKQATALPVHIQA